VRVEQVHRCVGDTLSCALELADAGFESGNVLAEDLGARLALAIVVLAYAALLRPEALLACRPCTIAALYMYIYL
jgi:hypothetical protein